MSTSVRGDSRSASPLVPTTVPSVSLINWWSSWTRDRFVPTTSAIDLVSGSRGDTEDSDLLPPAPFHYHQINRDPLPVPPSPSLVFTKLLFTRRTGTRRSECQLGPTTTLHPIGDYGWAVRGRGSDPVRGATFFHESDSPDAGRG